PGQVEANISMLNGLRNQLESVSGQLRSEQDRLSLVEQQLDAMKSGNATMVTSGTATAVPAAHERLHKPHQELAQGQALRATDTHPDVIRIHEEIAAARTELTAAKQQSPAGRDDLLAADPAFKQKTAERDTSRLRIATLTRAEGQIRSQITQYQGRVESAPMV